MKFLIFKIRNTHRRVEESLRGTGLSKVFEKFSELVASHFDLKELTFQAGKLENCNWALANGYFPKTKENTQAVLESLFNLYDEGKLSEIGDVYIGLIEFIKYKDKS